MMNWQKQYRNESNQLHRIDGPAVIHSKGGVGYYLKGRLFQDFNEWCAEAEICDEDRVIIKLKYGGKLIRIKKQLL